MTQVCYSLEEAAEKLGVSETVLVRLSQYFKMPVDAYEDLGYLSFKGDLTFLERDLHFFREVRERLLEGESLEEVKNHLLPAERLAPPEPPAVVEISQPPQVPQSLTSPALPKGATAPSAEPIFRSSPPASVPKAPQPQRPAINLSFSTFIDDMPAKATPSRKEGVLPTAPADMVIPKQIPPPPKTVPRPPKTGISSGTDSPAQPSGMQSPKSSPRQQRPPSPTRPQTTQPLEQRVEQRVEMTQSVAYKRMAEKTFARYKDQVSPKGAGEVLRNLMREMKAATDGPGGAGPVSPVIKPKNIVSSVFQPGKIKIPAASFSPLLEPQELSMNEDVIHFDPVTAQQKTADAVMDEEWSNELFATKTFSWNYLMGEKQRRTPGMSSRLQEAALQLRAHSLRH